MRKSLKRAKKIKEKYERFLDSLDGPENTAKIWSRKRQQQQQQQQPGHIQFDIDGTRVKHKFQYFGIHFSDHLCESWKAIRFDL